jgi:hypothetical protein
MTTMAFAMMTVMALSLTSILTHISPTPTATHVAATHITAAHVAVAHVAVAHVTVLREDECAEAHYTRQNEC